MCVNLMLPDLKSTHQTCVVPQTYRMSSWREELFLIYTKCPMAEGRPAQALLILSSHLQRDFSFPSLKYLTRYYLLNGAQ